MGGGGDRKVKRGGEREKEGHRENSQSPSITPRETYINVGGGGGKQISRAKRTSSY